MEDSPDEEDDDDLAKKTKLGKRGRSTDTKKGSGVSLEYEYEHEVTSKPEKQVISQKNKRRAISKSTAADSVDF